MFLNAKAIVSFTTNPIPLLTGSPGSDMFRQTIRGMTGLTSLPANFLNTSGLTGAPASSMFYQTCRDVTGVKTLPDNFMNTASLTGAPAVNMFFRSCYNMTGVTNFPANFMNASGLTGPPATDMFYFACYGMSSVIAGDFNISSNVTFATTNIASSMASAFANMTKWTGTVYWGTSRIYDAIPNPATDANTFQNSTNVPDYSTTMQSNWR
jgi:hypothetical protein